MNGALNSILNNHSQKSSSDKVFLYYLLNRGDLAEIAKYLVSHGFTPVPIWISDNGLQPLVKLKEFELQGSLQEKLIQITKVFSTTRANGIAIKCGKASNIIVIDVDDPEKFERFYPIEKLKEEASYVVKTKDKGHFHFGFLYDEEFKNEDFTNEAGFELKTDGTITTFYTTVADYWYTVIKFDVLKPLPNELREKIKELIASRESIRFKPPKHLLLPREELDNILKKVEEITHKPLKKWRDNPPTWRGLCPAHNDTIPSFDVELYEDGIFLHCWGSKKCKHEEIARVLGYDLEAFKLELETKRTSISTKALKLLQEGNFSFWMSQYNEAYISINDSKHLKVKSEEFKDYLQTLVYETENRTLHHSALEEVVRIVKEWCKRSGLVYDVYTRVGYDEENRFIEVNLVRPDGKILRITPDKIELDTPKLKFINSNQLPIPFNPDVLNHINFKNLKADEVMSLFSKVYNIQTKEDLALLLAWMLKTFYPVGEYPILAILGEREAVGKTTMTKYIVSLLDPSPTPVKSFPRTLDDLYVLARNNFILAFDNLSKLSDDDSDALCQISTGSSLSKRRLYTDLEAINYPVKNPVIINSIYSILIKRDLRRRSIVLELKRPEEIKTQKQIQKTFEETAPTLYSYIVSCVQEALKEKVIEETFLDLADFCEWVIKAHPVFFLDGKSFINILSKNRTELSVQLLESHYLYTFIKEKLAFSDIWETTASELLEELKTRYSNEKYLDKFLATFTPERVTKEIKKIATDLETAGIKVEFERTRDKRKIIFSKIEEKQKFKGEPCNLDGDRSLHCHTANLDGDACDSVTVNLLVNLKKEKEGENKEEFFRKEKSHCHTVTLSQTPFEGLPQGEGEPEEFNGLIFQSREACDCGDNWVVVKTNSCFCLNCNKERQEVIQEFQIIKAGIKQVIDKDQDIPF